MRLFFGTLAAIVMFVPFNICQAADDPLAYVPSNASVLIHLRAGDLWNSSLVQEARKAAAKDLDGYLADVQKEIGISIESVATAIFFYPNMPQGPGDEQTFAVVV